MQENDDIGQDYVSAPEPTLNDMLAELQKREARERAQLQEVSDVATAVEEDEKTRTREPMPADWTVTGETAKAVWGAAVDSVSETFIFAKDSARTLLPLDSYIQWAAEGGSFADAAARADAGSAEANRLTRAAGDDLAPDNQTLGGNLLRGAAQFLIPYVSAVKAANVAGKSGIAAQSGLAIMTDMAAFDPNQGNVSSFLRDKFGFADPVTEVLATDPSDPEPINRLRNAAEGFGLGKLVDGIVSVVQGTRIRNRNRKIDAVRREIDAEPGVAVETPKADEPEVKAETPSGVAEVETIVVEKPVKGTLRRQFELDPETKSKLVNNIESGDWELWVTADANQAREMLTQNTKYWDWDNIEDPDDVRALMRSVEELTTELVNKAKGGVDGVQSDRMTQRGARLVGVTAHEAHKLYRDVRGNNGIAARMLAVDTAVVASAGRLKQLAAKLKASGADADRVALHRHIELHAAIMAAAKGSSTEIARALRAKKLMKQAAAESFKEFDELRMIMGDHSETSALLDEILASRSAEELAALTLKRSGSRYMNVVMEVAINGLLSAPKTHMVNLASNAGNMGLTVADRLLVGGYHAMRRGDWTKLSEARAQMTGMLQSFGDARRMAAQAFREGAPQSDPRARVQSLMRQSIAYDPGANATAYQKALANTINVLGTTIRLPGRVLVTGDEFFKVMNSRSELRALAYRQALNESVNGTIPKGRTVASRADEIFREPSIELQVKATQAARYATFQEDPTTQAGASMEQFLHRVPIVKLLFVPFFRTPMNIIRQGLVDRTVLAPITKRNRDLIVKGLKGDPDGQIAVARMFVGTSALVGGYALVNSGGPDAAYEIRGRSNPDPTRRTSAAGGQAPEYAIRLGDRWFQFNRMDPMGSWLGVAADFHTALSYHDPEDPYSEENGKRWVFAATMAMYNNALSKTWNKSLSDFEQAMTTISTARNPEVRQQAIDRLLGQQLIKLVPYSSLARTVTGEADESTREAWTILDQLKAIGPGQSEELPIRRDILGREVPRNEAMFSWLSPIPMSKSKDSAINRELLRLKFTIDPDERTIRGGAVALNSRQYSELGRLAGETPLFGGQTLPQFLDQYVQSDAYKNLPTDHLKTKQLKAFISGARTAAEGQLLMSEPDLQQKFTATQKRKFSHLTGVPLE